jgi:starch-binding outer membrane protein, SusD/RagB family
MKKIKLISVGLCSLFLLNSCTQDLNTEPKVEKTLAQLLEEDPNAALGLLSRLYAAFALSGPSGPASSDISDNAGESPFLRGIINLEDFTADGLKNRWGDNGLDQLTTSSNWDENNKFFRYLYNRVYYTVPQCNNVIQIFETESVPNGDQYISEARFLRALAYFYMIDCFGKGVLVTEDDLGSIVPKPQSTRLEMYNFVESELLDIENSLPLTNGYGRVNRAVARTLLAKLYLNAEVYTGTSRYDKALQYCSKVIDEGGYTLAPEFLSLFSGDNNVTAAKNEIIYALIADPISSQSYGNTTYMVNGSLSTVTMTPSQYGATSGWQGHRASKGWYGLYQNSNGSFVQNAEELENCVDKRSKIFWTNRLGAADVRHNWEMDDYKTWTDGFPAVKFRNSNFASTSVATEFSGADFPLYRLADVYLMYAESVLRGGGGSNGTALDYVNAVRTRSNALAITSSQLTLDFLLDERARELNFEGHRRTDLIRFGKFTGGSYLWPWKGNSKDGSAIPLGYNLFPIPLKAIEANPNLTQNPGY